MRRSRSVVSGLIFLFLLVFFVITCLLGLRNHPLYVISILFAALISVLVIWMPRKGEFLLKTKKLHFIHLILLILLTFLPRLLWINSLDIPLFSDYQLYHELALDLSQGTFRSGTYIALFPHIFAYPAFLSLVYQYFGAQITYAQILNACLGVGIVLGVYWLGSKILTPNFGLLAGIIVSLWPSQIMFTSLVASEVLFTFLLVGCICYLLWVNRKQKLVQRTFLWAGLGVAISIMNAVRPVGLLFLASFVVYALVFSPPIVPDEQHLLTRSSWVHKLVVVTCVCSLYFLSNAVFHRVLENRLNLKVGKSFVGYSLLVGSNLESGGMWNQSDADLQLAIYQVGRVHPDLVDRELLKQAIRRIASGPREFIMLQFKKNYAMWQEDRYGIDRLHWTVKQSFLAAYTPTFLKVFYSTINYYYFTFFFLCITGCIFGLINREQGFMIFIALFLAAMVITFVFTEVQSRYHYPIIPILSLLTCYGLFHLREKMFYPSRLGSIG